MTSQRLYVKTPTYYIQKFDIGVLYGRRSVADAPDIGGGMSGIIFSSMADVMLHSQPSSKFSLWRAANVNVRSMRLVARGGSTCFQLLLY